MKLLFFLLLLLDDCLLEGLVILKAKRYGQFVLKLTFHPAYNHHVKSCCKLNPSGFSEVMDSQGLVIQHLKSRTTIHPFSGGIEFSIWNAQPADAGLYRCIFYDNSQYFYKDFKVEILEMTGIVPLPTHMLTILPPTTTREPVLFREKNNSSSVFSGFLAPVAAALGVILLFIASTVAIVLVHRRVKATDKSRASSGDSFDHKVYEMNNVVYTIVDFKIHEKEESTGLYANLCTHNSQTQDPDLALSRGNQSSVEYATLAIGHSI